jgi:hypothetical protein
MRKVRPEGPDRVMRNPGRACATHIWELPPRPARGSLTNCHNLIFPAEGQFVELLRRVLRAYDLRLSITTTAVTMPCYKA